MAIVIPAFNEELNLPKVLSEVDELRANHPELEILPVVVNDGSSDGTKRLLDELAPLHRARAVNLPLNLGIGKCVQTGFRVAFRWDADVTIQLDGDGQHPASEVPKIVAPVLRGEADVVVGSRYVEGAGGRVSSPFRRAGTAFFSWLLRALVGVKVTDPTSGFRAFSAEAGEFISRHYPDDYPEPEAYIPLVRRGFRVREVAVTMRPRDVGESSITPILAAYYMLKVAFATVIDRIRPIPERRPRSSRGRRGGQPGVQGPPGSASGGEHHG